MSIEGVSNAYAAMDTHQRTLLDRIARNGYGGINRHGTMGTLQSEIDAANKLIADDWCAWDTHPATRRKKNPEKVLIATEKGKPLMEVVKADMIRRAQEARAAERSRDEKRRKDWEAPYAIEFALSLPDAAAGRSFLIGWRDGGDNGPAWAAFLVEKRRALGWQDEDEEP